MTRLFQLIAELGLLASVAAAQQAPLLKPSAPPQGQEQAVEGYDIAIAIGVDEPGAATVIQVGPLTINATFDATVTAARQAVLQQAINEWEAIVQDSGSTPNPYAISFTFSATDPNCAGTCLALTTTTFNTMTGNLIRASMVFNTNQTFFEGLTNPPPGSGFDLLSIARHEIGHALGWTATPRVNNLLVGSAFNSPRLNIPVVTATGLHTDPAWMPNDLMVPTIGQVTRRPISLYPVASLVARAYDYRVPMQYVDPTFAGTETGTAGQPWQTVPTACTSSPLDTPLLLSNATHLVPVMFQCASRHVVNAARGGAVVRP